MKINKRFILSFVAPVMILMCLIGLIFRDKTKKILERYSYFPKEHIMAGCALRFESLQNLSLLKCRKETKNNFIFAIVLS